MLDELFTGTDELFGGDTPSMINKDSLNCASYLEKPELPRNESNFVGFINQGGTCYMNSSLQVLYMNPIFRQIIYDLPLCKSDGDPSNFINQGQMFEILLTIQKLFIHLERYNIRSISTKSLTDAFEWSGSDSLVQHDSQEFLRLFFESLDGILSTTAFNGVINNLFRVVTTASRTCMNCNFEKKSDEFHLDITLIAKGSSGLVESLESMFNNYEVINDYKCDECAQRGDLKVSNKICQLPVTLTCVISKMDYDFNTGERIKIASKYDFPLELDMKRYFVGGGTGIIDEYNYELYAVIIHRGTPYSGHYFSYIRDINHEGNWNLNGLTSHEKEIAVPIIAVTPVTLPQTVKKSNKKAKNRNEEECIKIY